MNSGVILALDVGERRIGVARASLIARLASPLTTIDRQKNPDTTQAIIQLVQDEGVSTVVVGLPRGLEGQETQQTAALRSFAAELTDKLHVPVVMQDEAATSVEAEARLKARGKPYDKGDIDAEAAALILQDYLEQHAGRLA